jgi:hypothetical protein
MRIALQQLAEQLRSAPHHWMGVTPMPLDPPKTPPVASMGEERTMQAFDYALGLAKDYWPEAVAMALVASNVTLPTKMNEFPPDFYRFEDPEVLLEFEGGDGGGPSADPIEQGPASLNDPGAAPTLAPATSPTVTYDQGHAGARFTDHKR